MDAIPEPTPEQNDLSSQAGQAKSAADEPTIEEIGSWDENKLLEWIQQKLSIPLKHEDEAKFLNAGIDGIVFLQGNDNKEFFQRAGLPLGPVSNSQNWRGRLVCTIFHIGDVTWTAS